MKRHANADADAGAGADTDAPALKRPRRADAAAIAAERHAFAAQRGGEFLGVVAAASSTAGAPSSERVKWRCAAGHTWGSRWSHNKSSGVWCATCARSDRVSARDYSARGLRALAAANGGECLDPDAPGGGRAPRRWRCGHAHEWRTTARSIAIGTTWCPHCARRAPLTLDAMRALAAARGGECLSAEYARVKAPLRWRCARGHEWAACANKVKNKGTWCPRCEPRGREGRQRIAARKAAADGDE